MRLSKIVLVISLLTPFAANAQIIGGPPAGCPRVAFCGCAVAKKVFGEAKRELWQAARWFQFARANPAPHMVGVRRHHVLYLLEHVHGAQWVVYDPNSGHHQTRVHVRDISGFSIRDPRRHG